MKKFLSVIIYAVIIIGLTILYKSENKILAAIVVYIGMSGGYFVLYTILAMVDMLIFRGQCMRDIVIIGVAVLILQVLHDLYVFPIYWGYSTLAFVLRVGQSMGGYCVGKFIGGKLNMRKNV